MRNRNLRGIGRLAVASAALLFCGCGGAVDPAGTDQQTDNAVDSADNTPTRAFCDHTDVPGQMHCLALAVTDHQGIMRFANTPTGLGAPDLQAAYKIPTTGGNGKIVAIVDAMDDPNAEADLAVYRKQYGLPPCTTANGCFQKVNQNGQASPLPAADSGWAGEISLDLDMASAGCPDCKILLVEANSPNMPDLGAAELMAVQMGAAVVSNSFGGTEDNTIAGTDAMYFSHPGVGIFVAAGDSGYGAEYPASSQYVTAVGGTKLVKGTGTRGWTETAWGNSFLSKLLGGGGSGCSGYIAKPSWQKDTGCGKRTVADVAAVAAPASAIAVYDTYGSTGGTSGWIPVGGTSAASPLVAAIYAVTGNGGADGSYSYKNTSKFWDVTSGSNGVCSPGYLCTAKAAYDGPTGNGTPNAAALAGH